MGSQMRHASWQKYSTFAGLVLSNTVLGAAFPIQLILGGLAGLSLASEPGWATLPASAQTLAGLLAAAPFSLLMGRFGRRTGFMLGAGLTLAGAIAATQALYTQSFALLCAAHFLMGAGWAAFQYFRFAAAEAVAPQRRPMAISLMLSSLLVAALLGPQIFVFAKDMLAPLPFAGAYAATGIIALLGVLPLALVRIPTPRSAATTRAARWQAFRTAFRRAPVRQAIAIAGLAQGIMVFLMIPTPIAMVGCGFAEATASDVVRWHIVAMFAPSFVTGFLIQRLGAYRIARAGVGITLLAACIAASGLSHLHFYGALIILGIGWNFGFIGATTMLERALREDEKASVQGANDTLIALVATVGAFSSGLVIAGLGWAVLALVAAVIVAAGLGALSLGRRLRPNG